MVSIAGGAAVAYVFVGLSPEVQAAGASFREATSQFGLRFLRYGVNFMTMLGFLFFYGMDQLVMRELSGERRDGGAQGEASRLFVVHIVVFAAYTWVVTHLLAESHDHLGPRLVFYAVAMALHFVSVGNTLRDEHGELYAKRGFRVLVVACAAGWLSGMTVTLPRPVLDLLLGLVAGGVMANIVISELPGGRQGRLVPFLLGALVYAGLLLLA